MDNSKDHGGSKNTTIPTNEENPNRSLNIDNNNHSTASTVNSSTVAASGVGGESMTTGNDDADNRSRSRTPFTNLSQVDADLALARTLQEQERAYMMLRMAGDGSDYGSWEAGSYGHEDDVEFDHPSEEEYDGSNAEEDEDEDEEDEEEEEEEEEVEEEEEDDEDAFDVHAHLESEEEVLGNLGIELDSSSFPSDEAYARALQDAEDRDMAARLLALAGINEMVTEDEDTEDQGGNSQDTWEDVDPDELSYEELLALGEVVGTESRGLSSDSIASLPSIIYKTQSGQNGTTDTCVICRLEYEDGDTLTLLSCKHSYHSECITNWLQINKVCPVCNSEVSLSGAAS